MKKMLTGVMATASVFLITSCASIIKPGVKDVKTVAVVSFQVNKAVYHRGGSGGYTGIGTLLKGQEKGGNPLLTRFLENGETRLLKELNSIGRFRVLPTSQVKGSGPYMKMVSKMNKLIGSSFAGGQAVSYQALGGYEVFPTASQIGNNINKEFRAKAVEILTEFARAVKVDAVMAVDFDIAYITGASIGGTGVAQASVGLDIFMVNARGEDAITAYNYIENSGTLGMVANTVLFEKITYPEFEKAQEKVITKLTADISKKLSE